MSIEDKVKQIASDAEAALKGVFAEAERISEYNTGRVLEAFAKHRVSEPMFHGTTGYGYDDAGREATEKIYAEVFGAEKGIVRHSIANGTHALTIGLFGLLRPGDVLLSITGRPYDTLSQVIGDRDRNGNGSLADFGIDYEEVPLKDGDVDIGAVDEKLTQLSSRVKAVFIQRSKGYMNRKTLSSAEIGKIIAAVRKKSGAFVIVDNCYGEFCDENEPSAYGADLVIGSLIKNPGGGIAESGGYLVGTSKAVELASYRLTSAGTGSEVGASLGQTKNILKGLFLAPHTVCQAKKTAAFAAYVFEKLGYLSEPSYLSERHDIIQSVILKAPEKLCAFCRGIQAGSPVDAFVTPEPWAMPGYDDEVIMAAGSFTQGSSIEISADGPLRPPYTAFMQGGLTYESGKYAVMRAAVELLKLD